MKRRDFFKYSATTLVLPSLGSELFASTTSVELQVFPTRTLKTKLIDIPKVKVKKQEKKKK